MNLHEHWHQIKQCQTELSKQHAAAFAQNSEDPNHLAQLRAYIAKNIHDNGFCPSEEEADLVELTYREMVEYSILTDYLTDPAWMDKLEEVNINGWDDVALTYCDGHIEKAQHFENPQQAEDILKRILDHSGAVIDNARPIAQAHLHNKVRVTIIKNPVVDGDRGIAASIRILHKSKFDKQALVEQKMASRQMIDFLCYCLHYGVSLVISGVTSSGKTTLLNALLDAVPDDYRLYTIETGSRELDLTKVDGDRIANNVVNTLSRPSRDPEQDISQETLVEYSLRFNPDVVVVGEMRNTEAYNAVESSLTGITVASTIHAKAGAAAHLRLALLCQKKFPIDFQTSLVQAAEAFPIVVYAAKMRNGERKVMDITEAVITPDGRREYRCLYRYVVESNVVVNGRLEIKGHFEQKNPPSESLLERLRIGGIPESILQTFVSKKE